MGFKSKTNGHHSRKLPLHTYDAHPVASGEIKKPFITAIIVIVSIIILSVFLLFSQRIFVGKAYSGVVNTAGINDVLITPNTPFSAFVRANIDTAETVAVGFTLNLPVGVSCTAVQSLLGWDQTNGAVYETARCDNLNNQVVFEYATLNTAVSHSGQFDIARINFSGAAAGNYNMQFSSFEVVDLATLNNLVTPIAATFIVTSAPAPVCGNSLVEVSALGPDEQCDDSNTISGDGCSSDCLSIEAGYTCSAGQPSVCTLIAAAACGDGVVDALEACDDSNTISGDGCSSDCLSIEAGYTCAGIPSVCTFIAAAACGDGVVDALEACDDSNIISGDGCSANCFLENGFTCIGTPSACRLVEVCGDGIDEGIERCDDSNIISGDGCSSDCLSIEAGYTCAGTPSVCTLIAAAICGNGVLNAGEACDDSNIISGDGCSAICAVESSYACIGQPSVCTTIIVPQGAGTFTTTITATANTAQSTIYTTLLTDTREILVFKSERIPAMTTGQTYTSTVTYPFSAQVRTKEVLVQDVPPNQGRTVYASQTDDVTVAGSITVTGTKITVR